jgi:predicted small secreted protein
MEVFTMKKTITLALVFVLALSLLTACGGNSDNGGGSTTTPPANSSTTPPASQGGNDTTPSNNGGDTAKSGELFDITDDQIIALNSSLVQVQGEERTTLLAKIPANIKKAIGTLVAGTCNIQPDRADGSGYLFNFNMTVSSSADYKTLTDYYKSLGGTISTETDTQLEIDYSWGELSDCTYGFLLSDTITVIFAID